MSTINLYAVYADTIYGLGNTVASAIADAQAGELVSYNTQSQYPENSVVDLTNFQRARPDCEAASGRLKIRRIDPALAALIDRRGPEGVEFEVDDNGVLVQADQ